MKVESRLVRHGRTTILAALRHVLGGKPSDHLHWQILGVGLLEVKLHPCSMRAAEPGKTRTGSS
jgi:hypothetical protein